MNTSQYCPSCFLFRPAVIALFACAVLLAPTSLAFADSADAEVMPQRGSLSSMRNFSTDNRAIDTFGDVDISGQGASRPITGSVSRASNRDWDVRVFNNSEDDYSVGIELLQFDQSGRQIRRDGFSATLRADTSILRTIRARPNAEQTELNITHWTNLSERRRKQAEAGAPEAAGEE